jgi:4-amino-4-deoxy-L-arabinose transferase-like glycosyltransferase
VLPGRRDSLIFTVRKTLRNPGLLLFAGLLLVIALAGAWLVRDNTPLGLGMYPDSVTYIMGARNLLDGNGFSQFSGTDVLKPITHYPPLYSYILAGIGLTGMDAIRVARFLNIVLMALSLLLFGGLVYHETRNKLLSILASLLFLFSVPLFVRYTWALTEPLFFMLLFGNFVLYYFFLHTRKPGWVAALGFGTGILFLARYVGVYMAAVWLPAILLLSMPKTRLKNAFLFLAGLLPLMGIHLLRNYLLVGSLNNRGIYLQGMPNASAKMTPGLSVLEGWFTTTGEGLASHTVTLVILCLLAAALLAGLVLCGLKLFKLKDAVDSPSGREAILFPLILALILYAGTVLLTIFFYDSQTNLDERILSPLWFFGLYILILGAGLVSQKGRIQKILVLACLLAALIFSVIKFQKVSAVLRVDGQGFFSEKWRILPGMEYIRGTNRELIYSDEPLAIYILTGKVAYQVPYGVIDASRTYEQNYGNYDFMRDRLIDEKGLLVLFDSQCQAVDSEWLQLLTRDLHLVEAFADTCVYNP